uniref:Immunoglobulin superfamily member 9 n=1 Tax=Monodelphis domestica TaxID=13616 RepID=A0A5F8HES5_MONDO
MIWCLAILSLLTSQGADGRVKPETVTVVGRTGESALLSCDLLPPTGRPPLHVIEWLRFGFLLPIFIQFGLYSPRVDPHYVGRVRLQEGASLIIERLQTEDQGWYECRVLFLDQPNPEDDFANGSWVHLTVNSPPRFLEIPPTELEVREWDPVTLHCAASGSPQPHVAWKRDGRDLGQGQGQVQVQNGTLRIGRVEQSSAGIYTCHASNTEGSATHTTHLLVHGPPVIIVPPENSTVNASQDASLACQAQAHPANLTYSWYQGSTNVFHISRLQPRVRILVDGSLRLQATQPDDAGRYTCVPSNGLRHPPSASAYLTVLYPAQVTAMPPETPLPVGMQGVIRCPTRANPPLLFVNWTKDGQALHLDKFPGWSQASDGSLVIALGNEDALGEYTCTPYNSHGTAGPSSPTRVLLKAPPAFIEQPKKEYFQEVGRELLIPCSAGGDPPPAPPSPLPAPGPLLQYLSLPFFREMNVDGDWPPAEEPSPALPLDYMDTRPGTETTQSRPLDSSLGLPKAVLPGGGVSGGGSDSSYTALADWTLRERGLPGPAPAVPRGSLTSQSSGRGSASFFRPPSLAPSLGGSYLSPPSGDTSSWASGGIGLERWPRREHVLTVSKRRNTSVDENYEWDSELPGDLELLESLHLGQRGSGLRVQPELKLGSKEPKEGTWDTAHLPGPEERCAALREEFLAFRRRRDATRARLPVRRDPISHPEQATLL